MKQNKYAYTENNQNNWLNKNKWLSEYQKENILFYLYTFGLLIVPMIITNQLIIGTIVNALLIGSAIKFKTKKVLVLSVVPSIAAFSAGVLFGSITHQVLLMLPFIWMGNVLLMILVRKLNVDFRKNYFYTLIASATGKTILLFTIALVLFTINLVPILALTAFGILQFATAIMGGILYYSAKKLLRD